MLHKVTLAPDTKYQIQFRRRNIDYVYGPVIEFTTIKNTKPPAKPSTPVVSAYLGQLVVAWNGQSATGEAYLPDFSRCEVHVGLEAGFTPSSNTMRDQFMHFGSLAQTTISDLEYNQTYYVKLVAYNISNVASEPSDEAHDTVRRISGIELEDGSINLDQVNLSRRGLRQTLTYYQPQPPSATQNPKNAPHWNDTWYDTDDNYRFYRYTHSGAEYTQGADESWEAFYDRNDAANDLTWKEVPVGTANQIPGSRTFYQAADPVTTATPAPVNGDVWYKTGGATGALVYVRNNGSWATVQFGLNTLGPGSVVASNIVANSITSNELAANSVTATQIAAGSIIASKIQSGQVTADKMAANSITAQNGAIANAAIDDAKIANVSAGKLSAGTITANIILSGNIRTATTGARVEIGSLGLFHYDASNSLVTALYSTGEQGGTAYIRGNIYATVFRSTGYQTTGYGYIEIGNTGPNDPTDEIRMFYGGAISSIRNPSDLPGSIRMSLVRPAVGVIDFLSTEMTVPSNFRMKGRGLNTWVGVEGNRVVLNSNQNNNALFIHGTDSNGNMLIRNGLDSGGAIKILGSENVVQIRNAYDGFYADLKARNANFDGTVTAGGLNIANVYGSSSVASGGQMSASGRMNAYGGMLVQGNAGAFFNYSPYNNYTTTVSLWIQGNVYSSSEVLADNNITSRSGFMYSRGHNSYSNPEFKSNITPITVDALDLLKNAKVQAWNWKDENGNPGLEPSIGLLTSELPNIVAPPDDDFPEGMTYSQTALDGLLVTGQQQLLAMIEELKAEVADLKSRLVD